LSEYNQAKSSPGCSKVQANQAVMPRLIGELDRLDPRHIGEREAVDFGVEAISR
jgi:hypothetical protein